MASAIPVVSAVSGIFGAIQKNKAASNAKRAAVDQVEARKVAEEVARKEAEIARTQIDLAELQVGVAQIEGAAAAIRNSALQSQYLFKEQVSLNNAEIAETLAADTRAIGRFHSQRQRTEGQRVISRQRAALAANGVVVDQGSALDIIVDTAGEAELDALVIEYNADRQAHELDVKAFNFRSDAHIYAEAADTARRQGVIDAVGSLFNIRGAELGVEGAELAAEGADLAIKGAEHGVTAARYGVQAAKYNSINSGLSLVTTGLEAYNTWTQASS